jgi:uncharacterized membrane protein YdjX (TVP38/TMEM64 family)
MGEAGIENEGAGDPQPRPARGPGARLRRWGPLVLLVAVAAVVVRQGWLDYLTPESLAANRDALVGFAMQRYWLALAAFCGLYVGVIALSLPVGVFLTLIGGFLFGWLVGGAAVVISASLGATIVFAVARSSLGVALAERAGPWLGRLRAGFAKNAVSYLLFLRLVPLFPFWLVNIAPALLGMPIVPFMLATLVGIVPGTFAFAVLGAGLDSAIAAQRSAQEACQAAGRADCGFSIDPRSLLTPELIAAFVALGVLALVPVVVRHVRAARRSRAVAE